MNRYIKEVSKISFSLDLEREANLHSIFTRVNRPRSISSTQTSVPSETKDGLHPSARDFPPRACTLNFLNKSGWLDLIDPRPATLCSYTKSHAQISSARSVQ
ncbi:hypothetical protein DSO57_1037044 [Entomophthora muscae]|uniref:Uncharacterized protein n=1 Tax=Entomophthora muscae TaxID=34485 RepID=A0ACC2TXR8_9FUNG|nr:hypothetical protein DSO57_1037044 [Entomophthora muscae]